MKIKFLFSDFKPQLKCGSALSAVTGMLSGAYNAQQSGMNVSAQLGAQKEENALNRAWQTEEAEKARQFNTSERLAAQQYGIDMMKMQNEYNSPVNQVRRLQAAGQNPNIVMSGNVQNVSAQSNPSTPATSPMPSGVSGLSPVGFQPSSLNVSEIISSIGGLMNNLASAKQKGVDTDIMARSAEWLIKSNMLDAQGKELINSWQFLNNEIFDNTKDARIRKIWNEANKSYNDWLLSGREYARQDLIDKSIKIQNELNEALKNYHGENAILLSMEVKSFNEKLNSFLELNKAQTNAANASAALSLSEKESKDIANKFERGVVDDRIITMLSELKKNDKQNSADYQKAIDMLNKYKRLNSNNENGAASYLNYLLWFLKEHCPSLPIVPFLNMGK